MAIVLASQTWKSLLKPPATVAFHSRRSAAIPQKLHLYELSSCSVAVVHNLTRITCPIHCVPAGRRPFSDQPTPAVKSHIAYFVAEAGLCLLADAAVAAITWLPLLSSQGPANLDILAA